MNINSLITLCIKVKFRSIYSSIPYSVFSNTNQIILVKERLLEFNELLRNSVSGIDIVI